MTEWATIASAVALVLSTLAVVRSMKEQKPPQIFQVVGGGNSSTGKVLIHRVVSIGRGGEIQFFNGNDLATSIQFPGADELLKFKGAMADVYIVPRAPIIERSKV